MKKKNTTEKQQPIPTWEFVGGGVRVHVRICELDNRCWGILERQRERDRQREEERINDPHHSTAVYLLLCWRVLKESHVKYYSHCGTKPKVSYLRQRRASETHEGDTPQSQSGVCKRCPVPLCFLKKGATIKVLIITEWIKCLWKRWEESF